MDNADPTNMGKLVTIGEQLLGENVATMHLTMGTYLPDPNGGTNREALRRFAKLLVKERNLRLGEKKEDEMGTLRSDPSTSTPPVTNDTQGADESSEPPNEIEFETDALLFMDSVLGRGQ